MDVLTHLQLLIHYETRIEILTSLHHHTTIHIYDHIHEWRRRLRLIRDEIPYQFLADWFVKSLFPNNTKDVAMPGDLIEEQVILCA